MAFNVAISDMIFFSVFEPTTKQLLYTKYNFKFDSYNNDFNLGLPITQKKDIFMDFLKRNDTTFDKPYQVSQNLVKYFSPMTQKIIDYMNKYGYCNHPGYLNIHDPLGYISYDVLVEEQFDLIEYTDDQIRRIQDYYWNADKKLNTKWNFDFNQYSKDLNVYGSKLLIFTDFMVRCNILGNSPLGYIGYGTYPPFEKYFIQSSDLANYIIENGVTSAYSNVPKSLTNIDFLNYKKLNTGLNLFATIEELKNHYLCYGQFERRIVPLLTNPLKAIDRVQPAIGTIFVGNSIGTCFLIKDQIADPNIYLVTCYHIIGQSKKIDIVLGTFEIKSDSRVPKTVTAAFKFVGYDQYTDIYLAVYDDKLDYNVSHNVSLDMFTPLQIKLSQVVKRDDEVCVLANMGFNTNMICVSGQVMDPNYSGEFNNVNVLSPPDCILTNLSIVKGASGAPLFLGDANGYKDLDCVGMINYKIKGNDAYSCSVNSFILSNLISNLIGKYTVFSVLFKDDIQKLNYQLKNAIVKKWLGVKWEYFHPFMSVHKCNLLKSLVWVGGIVVYDFILGFDYISKRFITLFEDMTKQGITKLNTPLLKTKMYSRFLYNSRVPIVIKSVQYFSVLTSEYNKFYFGKFSNQVSYSYITYNLLQTATKYISDITPEKYTNTLAYQFGDIILEYYYYDGKDWILDTEIISGNGPDKYEVYTDNLGYKYLQHQLELPFILIPYLDTYESELNMQCDDDMYGESAFPVKEVFPAQREDKEMSGGNARAAIMSGGNARGVIMSGGNS